MIKRILGILGILLAITLFIAGATFLCIGMISALEKDSLKEVNVPCYDKYSNQIVGLTCKETKLDQDIEDNMMNGFFIMILGLIVEFITLSNINIGEIMGKSK